MTRSFTSDHSDATRLARPVQPVAQPLRHHSIRPGPFLVLEDDLRVLVLTSDANSGSARVIFRAIAPEAATSDAFGILLSEAELVRCGRQKRRNGFGSGFERGLRQRDRKLSESISSSRATPGEKLEGGESPFSPQPSRLYASQQNDPARLVPEPGGFAFSVPHALTQHRHHRPRRPRQDDARRQAAGQSGAFRDNQRVASAPWIRTTSRRSAASPSWPRRPRWSGRTPASTSSTRPATPISAARSSAS